MTKQDDQQLELMASIDNKLAKGLSLKNNFIRGIVRGLGTAIGATIIAAIAFAILSSVVRTVDDVPIIEDVIDKTNVQQSN